MKKNILIILSIFIVTTSFSQSIEVQPVDESFKQFMNTRDFTLSGDAQEAYFTVQNADGSRAVIVKTIFEDGHWGDFSMVSFTGKYRDIEPFLSPDNLRLYFSSNRPKDETTSQPADYDIWYVERETTDSKWSEPVNIGPPVNTANNEFYPAVGTSKNIYYTSDALTDTRKDDIFVSEWEGSGYGTPFLLSDSINSPLYEFNAWISPDENVLIYTVYNAPDGLGGGDLYISRKNEKGRFEKRESLGPVINSDKLDYSPFYDSNNNTLYFTSSRNETPGTKVETLEEFRELNDRYANGQSRIYKVKIDLMPAN
ncbi:MAG: TolB family protein [Tangfeifania sp.]